MKAVAVDAEVGARERDGGGGEECERLGGGEGEGEGDPEAEFADGGACVDVVGGADGAEGGADDDESGAEDGWGEWGACERDGVDGTARGDEDEGERDHDDLAGEERESFSTVSHRSRCVPGWLVGCAEFDGRFER